jgi:esterase/lipase superfamily enzyme
MRPRLDWRFELARFLLVLSLVVLAACTPRANLTLFPAAAEVGQVRSVFVSTTRVRDPDGRFGGARQLAPSYLQYDISTPPDRPRGNIAWAEKTIDPNTQFLVTDQVQYPSAEAFQTEMRSALRQIPASEREALIYIHGFNNTFDEGLLRIAQLSNDFGIRGLALHYSWPSAGSPYGYEYDKDSISYARDGLEDLINRAHAAGARRIILVAHSMGAQLAVETLRQMEIARPNSAADTVNGVILISPDIDAEVFRSELTRIKRLPDPFVLFVSRRDRVLQVSGLLTGQRERLGNLPDYSSFGDLKLTVLDVTEFSSGLGHFTAGDSPALMQILANIGSIDAAFRNDRSARTGFLPGVVMTVRSATEIILSPITTIAQ